MDMSPTFAGTLMGLTNCAANMPGILAPIVVSAITKHDRTVGQWAKVFQLSAIGFVMAGFAFVCFSSAEIRKWDPCYDAGQEEEVFQVSILKNRSKSDGDVVKIVPVRTNSEPTNRHRPSVRFSRDIGIGTYL